MDSIDEDEFHASRGLLRGDGDDGKSISVLVCQDLTLNVPRREREVLGCPDGGECQREFHLGDLRWVMYVNNESYTALMNPDNSMVNVDCDSRGGSQDAHKI